MSKNAIKNAELYLNTTCKATGDQVSRLIDAINGTIKFLTQTAEGKRLTGSAPANPGSETVFVCPDLHFHWADPACVSLVLQAIAALSPGRIVLLGDVLEAGAFSSHRRKSMKEGSGGGFVDAEVYTAQAFLDSVQLLAPKAKLVILEGNHEARVESFAASLPGELGKAVFEGCKPSRFLSRCIDGSLRKNLEIIPYVKEVSHYEITPDLWAIHGWYAGENFCMTHLRKCVPISIVHGHVHRMAKIRVGNPINKKSRKVWSPGTLSLLQPLWMAPNPTDWVHGFSIVYVSRATQKWTDYTVDIEDNECVLPGGTQLTAILRDKPAKSPRKPAATPVKSKKPAKNAGQKAGARRAKI